MKISLQRRLAPLALAATLTCGGVISAPRVFAQTASAPQSDLRARTQKRVQTLLQGAGNGVRDLHLTDAQKSKLKLLAQKNAPLAKAIWSDNSLSQTQKMTKIRALRGEMRAILTPAQQQKLVAARGAAMGQLFETAMWVSGELNLSAQQQNQLKTIVMNGAHQARGGEIGALRSLILDTSGQIDRVLTPAQKSKWAVMKSVAREEIGKRAQLVRAALNS